MDALSLALSKEPSLGRNGDRDHGKETDREVMVMDGDDGRRGVMVEGGGEGEEGSWMDGCLVSCSFERALTWDEWDEW